MRFALPRLVASVSVPAPRAGTCISPAPTVRQYAWNRSNGGSRIDFVNTLSDNNWRVATKHLSDTFIITKIGTGRIELRTDSVGNLSIPGALTQGSDVNNKLDVTPVNSTDILDRVMELPIAFWRYRDDGTQSRHIGPMAQDFAQLFGVGADETRISTLDTSGVALAAVQALTTRLTEEQMRVSKLADDNDRLTRENARALEENEALHQRLARLESVVQELISER